MIWTNPHHREVDGDRREGFGLARRTLGLARISADACAYAYAYADAYTYADADADADAYAYDYACADAYTYAADDAYADAYADADADAAFRKTQCDRIRAIILNPFRDAHTQEEL